MGSWCSLEKMEFPHCHVEQVRTNPAQRESEGASKHPEEVNFAMLRQGVSTKMFPGNVPPFCKNVPYIGIIYLREFPETVWQRIHFRDSSTPPRSPSVSSGSFGVAQNDKMETFWQSLAILAFARSISRSGYIEYQSRVGGFSCQIRSVVYRSSRWMSLPQYRWKGTSLPSLPMGTA